MHAKSVVDSNQLRRELLISLHDPSSMTLRLVQDLNYRAHSQFQQLLNVLQPASRNVNTTTIRTKFSIMFLKFLILSSFNTFHYLSKQVCYEVKLVVGTFINRLLEN